MWSCCSTSCSSASSSSTSSSTSSPGRPWSSSKTLGLALAAGGGDPLHEVALAEEEDEQHRQGGDDAGGEHDLPLALAALPELVEDDLEAPGQGEQLAVAQADQRPHEVGPAGPELEHEGHDQGWPGQGQGDLAEQLQAASWSPAPARRGGCGR